MDPWTRLIGLLQEQPIIWNRTNQGIHEHHFNIGGDKWAIRIRQSGENHHTIQSISKIGQSYHTRDPSTSPAHGKRIAVHAFHAIKHYLNKQRPNHTVSWTPEAGDSLAGKRQHTFDHAMRTMGYKEVGRVGRIIKGLFGTQPHVYRSPD